MHVWDQKEHSFFYHFLVSMLTIMHATSLYRDSIANLVIAWSSKKAMLNAEENFVYVWSCCRASQHTFRSMNVQPTLSPWLLLRLYKWLIYCLLACFFFINISFDNQKIGSMLWTKKELNTCLILLLESNGKNPIKSRLSICIPTFLSQWIHYTYELRLISFTYVALIM